MCDRINGGDLTLFSIQVTEGVFDVFNYCVLVAKLVRIYLGTEI